MCKYIFPFSPKSTKKTHISEEMCAFGYVRYLEFVANTELDATPESVEVVAQSAGFIANTD